jgi:Fic family protein
VGGSGSTIETARFVPPPPGDLPALLADWERYAHEDAKVPVLIQNALLHYQFETLHPFLDGNGRLGRLLSVFLLVEHGRLPAPLLYLSAYLERDRGQYYDALQTIRERGDALPWIELFLGVLEAGAAGPRGQRRYIARELMTAVTD